MDGTIRKRLEEAEALHVGDAPMDSEVALCIYGDNLDPGFVSGIIKCSPTHARRKGERDPDRPKIPPARLGLWFLDAPRGLSFVDKIDFLLDSTTSDQDAWITLAESHRVELRATIYLRSWSEGFDLPSSTLARLSLRGWAFGVSMYSAEGDEILNAFLGEPPSSLGDSK